MPVRVPGCTSRECNVVRRRPENGGKSLDSEIHRGAVVRKEERASQAISPYHGCNKEMHSVSEYDSDLERT